jgi:hypothetical protein
MDKKKEKLYTLVKNELISIHLTDNITYSKLLNDKEYFEELLDEFKELTFDDYNTIVSSCITEFESQLSTNKKNTIVESKSDKIITLAQSSYNDITTIYKPHEYHISQLNKDDSLGDEERKIEREQLKIGMYKPELFELLFENVKKMVRKDHLSYIEFKSGKKPYLSAKFYIDVLSTTFNIDIKNSIQFIKKKGR